MNQSHYNEEHLLLLLPVRKKQTCLSFKWHSLLVQTLKTLQSGLQNACCPLETIVFSSSFTVRTGLRLSRLTGYLLSMFLSIHNCNKTENIKMKMQLKGEIVCILSAQTQMVIKPTSSDLQAKHERARSN